MNTLLSAASGKFAKALVLGTLLPVTLVAVGFLWAVDPSLPRVPAVIQGLDREWQAVLFVLVVTAIAGILYNMNATILRLYSGYPWSGTWFGEYATGRVKARWEPIRATRDRQRVFGKAAEALKKELEAAPEARAAVGALASNRTLLSRIVNDHYPFGAGLLLPTRLGNVLRNMEDYSRQRYGITAVLLWPRLLKVIDPAYATYLDDAKTTVDFALNLSLLCGIGSAVTTWMALRVAFGGMAAAAIVPLAVKAVAFGVLSLIFYHATIARVVAWGSLMRSAVDLFRLKLLEELGYEHAPKTRDAERAIWLALARELSFADAEPPWVPYAPVAAPAPQPSATPLAADATIGVLRGIDQPLVPRRFPATRVLLAIENTGAVPTDVRLTEVVPAPWAFVPQSVTDSGNDLVVQTTTPLTLILRGLQPGTRRDVSYRIQSLAP